MPPASGPAVSTAPIPSAHATWLPSASYSSIRGTRSFTNSPEPEAGTLIVSSSVPPSATLVLYQSLSAVEPTWNETTLVRQMLLPPSSPMYSLAAQKVVPSAGSSTIVL